MKLTGVGQFGLRIPEALVKAMEQRIQPYIDGLLVKPELLPGKIVVEQDDVAVSGPNRSIRWLFTAEFTPKVERKERLFSAINNDTSVANKGYWESWMVTMTGRVETEFDLHAVEVYVHREGGWERVWNNMWLDGVHRRTAGPPLHADGDPWPEPAGEPPTNKAYLSSDWLDLVKDDPRYDRARELLDRCIEAGAVGLEGEVMFDMTDDQQRRMYWQLTAEIQRQHAGG